MRPLHVLATLALFLLLAAPLASAQSASVTMKLQPPTDELTPGGRIVVQGTAIYTADATAYTSTTGIPVYFSIKSAPPWVSLVVSPSTGIFMLPMTPGAIVTSAVPFTIVIDAPEDAVGPATGLLEIVGMTPPHLVTPGATGLASMPIKLAEGEPLPCDDAFSIQANNARPIASPDMLGGLALAGSAWGIGLGVALAGRRPKLLAILAGLALVGLVFGFAIPTAAAQGSAASMLEIKTLDEKVTAGAHITVPARFAYVADATTYSNTAGIPVTYHVKNLPPWVTVSLQPSSDVLFPPTTPAVTMMAATTFLVDILVDENMDASQLGLIEIVATTSGNAFTPSTTASGVVGIGVHVPPACKPEPAAAAESTDSLDAANENAASTDVSTSAPATQDDSSADATVGVQTSASTLRTGAPIIAVAGILGALVGFVLYRRLG